MRDLTVSHFSIPAYDETGEPSIELGESIASNKTLLRGGELLYSKLNSHKPRAWIVPKDESTKVASTEFIPLVGWQSACTHVPYFKHIFGSDAFADYISCFQTSVTNSHKRISPNDLWCTTIPLPLADEQNRIASYLDASCRAIDAAVAAKQDQIDVLARSFKATLQRTITCGIASKPAVRKTGNPWLSKVPSHWGLVMLKRLCDIRSGLTLGKEYEGDLVERPYLRVANVQDGHMLLDDLSTIDVPLEVAARTTLRAGDVLMTEGGDLDKLGRGVVWQGEVADCLHQNHVFSIRCRAWKLRPQFLAYVSAAQYGRDYFEATGKKTTNLAATNSTKVGQFPIPLPPIDEQDELIAYLDRESGKVGGLRALLEQQIETLTAYRKSLIHECVTGQRRITDEDVNRVTAHAASLA